MTSNEENRMLATAVGGAYSYGYRADGLRAWKKEASYLPKTYYLYDQGNIVCELDASGNCTKNNAFAPDGLFACYGGHSLGIYSFDHQGNVVRVNDAGLTDIRFSYNGAMEIRSGKWIFRRKLLGIWKAECPRALERLFDRNYGTRRNTMMPPSIFSAM